VTADDADKPHRALLGEDLWELLQRSLPPLERVLPLTTLPSKELSRGSFRLEFADGTIRKGRRFGSGAEAERVAALCGLLDHRFFPQVEECNGAALLIEWTEGRALRPDQLTPALMRQCGEIMGAMHVIAIPEELRVRYGCGAAGWQARLGANIEELVDRHAWKKREAQLARQLSKELAPNDAATGLIHGDFCAENFIESKKGRIAIVDNETLSVDVCAYDLARTWSRWPMDQRQMEAFYDGYQRHRAATDFLQNHLYWGIAVLTEAVVFRLRAATVGAETLLERLRMLLEFGELGESPLP